MARRLSGRRGSPSSRTASVVLTLGAKVGPSIANRDAFNRGGADFAGLPAPMCYVESILLASRFAAGTAIVADAGPGIADGFVEHLAYSFM